MMADSNANGKAIINWFIGGLYTISGDTLTDKAKFNEAVNKFRQMNPANMYVLLKYAGHLIQLKIVSLHRDVKFSNPISKAKIRLGIFYLVFFYLLLIY